VTGSWFTFPAWPIALWAAWSLRRRWREPELFVAATATLFMLVAAAYWGPTQDVQLIPLLAPLALLAARGTLVLRRGAAGALDWFGVLGFGFFGALIWFCWFAVVTGVPPLKTTSRTAPGSRRAQHAAVAFALLLAAAWVYLIFFTTRSPMRSLLRWAGILVLLWGTGGRYAVGGLPEELPLVALQLRSRSGQVELHRAESLGGVADGGVRLPCGHPHAGVRHREAERLPRLLVQGTRARVRRPGAAG
jgi:hypothetical protein